MGEIDLDKLAAAAKTNNLNDLIDVLKISPESLHAKINGDSILHIAVVADQKEMADFLILRGISPNEKNASGATPLHKAVSRTVVELLLARGADINARDNGGRTPLHVYALHDRAALLEYCLYHGADVNAQDENGTTPLHQAIAGGHEKLVDLLLLMNANTNAADSFGDTPLHCAVLYNNIEIAKALIYKGAADVNKRNGDGNTPLTEAKSKNLIMFVQLLTQYGATE